MRLVLDASAAVNLLLPTPARARTRSHVADAELYAPGLMDTEVLSALARLERTGAISQPEATAAVHALGRLPCLRVGTDDLLEQIWSLRHGVRISDAHYVVMAQALDATLVTADGRLSRAPLPREVSVLLVQ